MKPSTGNEASKAVFTPFPFCKLPPETQLRVLEHTDLVGPTRHFTWDSKSGFKLPRNVKRGSWRNPRSCFLVSRSFYIKARETFWKLNTFEVVPDTKPFFEIVKPGEPSNMPARYAACEFLGNYVPAQSLPYLRSLYLKMFGRADEADAEEAREKWFQTIDYAVEQGLNLSSLYVDGHCLDQPECEALETTSDDEKLRVLRTSIIKNVWPMSMEKALRGISDNLLVECQAEIQRFRYGIRRGCEGTLGSHCDPKWGSPRIQHRLSLKDDSGGEAKDWVEEVWFEKVKRTEY